MFLCQWLKKTILEELSDKKLSYVIDFFEGFVKNLLGIEIVSTENVFNYNIQPSFFKLTY